MMKKDFEQYLNGIGIVDLFYERTELVVQFYERLYPDEIKDIFVCEYIDNEGKRQYESLWLFSSRAIMMEAKRFLTDDDFDATPFSKRIVYWKVNKTEFDFENPTEKSRLTVEFHLVHNISGTLKASKENCNNLYHVLKKWILPNMAE